MTLRKVGVQLVAEDVASFSSAIDKFNSEIRGAGKLATSAGQDINKFGDVSKRALREVEQQAQKSMSAVGGFFSNALSTAAGFLAANAFSAIASSIGDFIDGASEATQIEAQLNAVLASTNSVAGVTAQKAKDIATAMMNLSGVDDEAVLSAENLLLTFTNIGSAVFPSATQAVLDMATAMNHGAIPSSEQLSLTAIQIGKALQDPIGGITALTRAGVNFTDAQKEQVKAMVESGEIAKAQAVILRELQTEFGGSAKAAGQTFSGQLAILQQNLADVGEGALAALQTGFLPLLNRLTSPESLAGIAAFGEGLATTIGNAMDFISNTAIPALLNAWQQIAPVVEFAVQAVQFAASVFGDLANSALIWGQNLIVSFANGIDQGVGYVVSSLGYVGDVITSWLQPGSPPKLLPNIDTWGEDTANVYMDGWRQADFSAIGDIGSHIETILTGFSSVGKILQSSVIPTTIATRDAFADALDEMKRTGSVSSATFSNIRTMAGAAGSEIEQYARSMIAVQQATAATAKAQEDLNAVTRKYDAQLSPLEDQLRSLQDAQQTSQEDARINDLQNLISFKNPPGFENDTTAAQAELDEIMLKRKIATIKKARDVELKSSTETLNAAKTAEQLATDQFATQKALIDQQIKTNDLLAKQVKLLERASKASGGGGGGAGGRDQGAADAERAAKAERDYQFSLADTAGKIAMVKEELAQTAVGSAEYYAKLQQLNGLEQQQQRDLDAVTKAQRDYQFAIADTPGKIAMLRDELAKTAPGSAEYFRLLTQLNQLETQNTTTKANQAGAVKALGGSLPDLIAPINHLGTTTEETAGQVDTGINGMVGGFAGMLSSIQQTIRGFVTSWQGGVDAITSTIASYRAMAEGVFNTVATFIQLNGAEIQSFVSTTWTQISGIIQTAIQIIGLVLTSTFTAQATFLAEHGDKIQLVLKAAWDAITSIITGALNIIQGVLNTALALLRGDWQGAWDGILKIGTDFNTAITGAFTGLFEAVLGIFDTNLETLKTNWDAFWAKIVTGGAVIVSEITAVGSNIVKGIGDGISAEWGKLMKLWNDLIAQIPAEVKQFLGIASPSRLMAITVGRPITQGIAAGMVSAIPTVEAATAAVMHVTPPASASQQSSMEASNTNNNQRTYNYAPTYAAAPNNPQYDFAVMQAGALG